MSDVTRILSAIEQGDPHAAEQLLPLVYDELRRLAAARMTHESPGHTLQATDLVHEAYLRLVDNDAAQHWNSRGHFFGAAAEAMRRILVDRARHRRSHDLAVRTRRVEFRNSDTAALEGADDLLALDQALSRLESEDAPAANLVKLRYFAGLTVPQAAEALGISLRSAERNWTYARTWLHRALANGEG